MGYWPRRERKFDNFVIVRVCVCVDDGGKCGRFGMEGAASAGWRCRGALQHQPT